VLAITSDNRIVTLRLTGIPGQVYQLEASTDLLNWVKLDQTTTGSDGLLVFTDHAQNLYPRRYYRAAQ
jgi:hypothetical protein